jgi:hypothetical protein
MQQMGQSEKETVGKAESTGGQENAETAAGKLRKQGRDSARSCSSVEGIPARDRKATVGFVGWLKTITSARSRREYLTHENHMRKGSEVLREVTDAHTERDNSIEGHHQGEIIRTSMLSCAVFSMQLLTEFLRVLVFLFGGLFFCKSRGSC